MARGWGFAFFFFFVKMPEKNPLEAGKMKDIYSGVEKSIKELQSIFKNTDNENERLKKIQPRSVGGVSKIRA